MSILIKGGYDSLRKTIINLSLLKTNLWQQGIITTESKKPICKLNSFTDNHLELVKYNDLHALRLNDMIVYERKHLFMYDVELLIKNDDCTCGAPIRDSSGTDRDENIYNYVTYYWVNYDTIKHINGQRYLN